MTTRDDLDRRLHAWLSTSEWEREPEHLLGEVLARTARTRRRPAWQIPERWFSMSAISSRFAPVAPIPWRAVGLAALLLLAIIAGALAIAGSHPFRPAPPFGLAANGSLAFSRDGDVLLLDRLGGTPATILGGPANDMAPQFSPDGSHLLILRDGGGAGQSLVWTRYDGSEARVILDGVGQVGWAEIAPRGDVVAVEIDSEPGILRVVPTDGSGSRQIDTGLPTVRNPIFRPTTGDQLTFEGWDEAGDRGIYLVNRDGTGLVRLELDPGFQDDRYYPENHDFYFNRPVWTADGARLAYHTLEPDDTSPAGPGFRIHIADVGGDGRVSNERILEFDPAMDDEFDLTWLPTGNSFIYQSLEGDEHRLWLADLDAADPPRDLGVVGFDGIAYGVSPDGTKILVALGVPGKAEPSIRMIDLASLDAETIDLGGSDVVWQRTAP
jgi:Tol biopolymer transport system component